MLQLIKRASFIAIISALCAACGSSSNGGSGQCSNIAGTWTVTGCGLTSCAVSQSGCSSNFTCTGGTKSTSGTVSGNNFSYSGITILGVTGTCSGTVNGTSMTGTCSGGGGSCTISGTKQ